MCSMTAALTCSTVVPLSMNPLTCSFIPKSRHISSICLILALSFSTALLAPSPLPSPPSSPFPSPSPAAAPLELPSPPAVAPALSSASIERCKVSNSALSSAVIALLSALAACKISFCRASICSLVICFFLLLRCFCYTVTAEHRFHSMLPPHLPSSNGLLRP